MPSSPSYKRNYKQEAASESPERQENRAKRMAAHRAFEKASGREIPPGYDVDHRKPLSKGGSNKPSNTGLQRSSSNRSYPRNSKGGMKNQRD